MDTNVVVAGLRSPSGASARLLELALDRRFTLVLSVALALEFESVCNDPGHRIASGLREDEVNQIISALCAVAEPVSAHNALASTVAGPGR